MPGYVHESVLGSGPTGEVVRATRETDGAPVTITYLAPALAEDPEFRAAFRVGAERHGTLESPYVPRLYAYVEDGPHAAVVRETVEGAPLAALLGETDATTPEAALTLLKGTLLGLSAAHEAGIAGGAACEPANLMVTAAGTAALVDLGGAPATPGAPDGSATPEAPLDIAADLRAATATCQVCLTGRPPHTDAVDASAPAAADPGAAAEADADAGAPIPEPVRPLLARGLSTDPAERPQSAIDFAVELEAVAVAAYGEAWEERGKQELAALVGAWAAAEGTEGPVDAAAPVAVPLPAPAPVPQAGPGYPGAAGSANTGTDRADAGIGGLGIGRPEESGRRMGRRTKALLIAAAAVVVAGALTAAAVVIGGKHDDAAAANPTPSRSGPSATTSQTGAASPSPDATTTSPTATTPPATASSTPTGPSATPTATATPSTAPATPPTTRAAAPTRSRGSAPRSHVDAISLTGVQCTAGGRTDTANATIRVRYDGSAGTLRVVWWRSATGTPRGAVDLVSPQTARFPKGATSFTYNGKLSDIAPDRDRPFVGITVSTSPAAASGNNSSAVVCR